MATLEARLSALEVRSNPAGPFFFRWALTGEGRAYAEVDGVRHTQEGSEDREQFLERLRSQYTGKRAFIWISEEDERL